MSRRRIEPRRSMSAKRRAELLDRYQTRAVPDDLRHVPSRSIYDHTDCGFDCRACDADLALEGRPDEVRWDDDLV